MQVERTSIADVTLRDAWLSLELESATCRAQSTWDWRRLWWKYFASRSSDYTLLVRHSNRPVAILPWMKAASIALGIPLPVVRFTGGWLADYNEPIVVPGHEREAVRAALRFAFVSERTIAADFVNVEVNFKSLLEEFSHEHGLHSESWPIVECRRIPITGDFEGFWAGLSRNTRRDVTRKSNRVEQQLGAEFRVVMEPAELRPWIPRLEDANRERWRAEGRRSSMFESSSQSEFFREMAEVLSANGRAVLFLLLQGSELVAYHFCYLFKGSLGSWNAGWRPQYASYSPGRVLEARMIEWAFGAGLVEIDFMRGDYRYKASWASEVSPNYRVVVARPKLVAKLGRLVQCDLRTLARQARQRVLELTAQRSARSGKPRDDEDL